MTTHSILINKSVSANSPWEIRVILGEMVEAATGETPRLIFRFKNNRHAFYRERVFHEDSRNQIRLIGVTVASQASLTCRIIAFSFFPFSAEFSYLERQRQKTLLSEHAAEHIIV
jgi:hypothetical protein